ncbi:MAG: Shedu anti-phage system protein SduA domain-containing protein [Gaiellaceae bacterium]
MPDEPTPYDPPPVIRPDADRLEQWNDPERSSRVGTFRFTDSTIEGAGPDEEPGEPGEPPKAPPDFIFMLFSSTKEIIFDVDEDGDPLFHFVVIGIDEATNELKTVIAFEGQGDEDSALRDLAYAAIFHVPVFPRNREVAPELARLQARLNDEGFTIGDSPTRYAHASRLPRDFESAISHLESQTFVSPADAALVAARLRETLASQETAARLLASLEAAVDDLKGCLATESANESQLQATLTRYPILFGTQYHSIDPKHRLGAEYEMDYALIQHSGVIDLVEIESSTHKLFKQNGDPTAALVHAEQQVLDWLSWIEDYPDYARRSLPGVARPVGYVVIGRSATLDDERNHRLARRNLAFRGSIEILTYDHLLQRAEQLLEVLTAASS